MEETLRNEILDLIEGSHLYILEIKKIAEGFRVLMDGALDVEIEELAKLNRRLRNSLEMKENEELDDCVIEFSSPGVGSRLKDSREVLRNIGRKVKWRQADNSELEGRLIGFGEGQMLIEHGKGKLQLMNVKWSEGMEIKVTI